MQKIHKILRTILILIGLLTPLASFSMDLTKSLRTSQSECSICGKRSAPKTKGVTKTMITWRKERSYNWMPTIPTDDLESSSSSTSTSTSTTPRKDGSPRFLNSRPKPMYKQVPITHVDECSHNICIECVKKSENFDPDDRGCRLCAYEHAQLEHAECNIDGCTNPTQHVKQYTKHTHGLCNDHNNEITKIHITGCNICYAQNNPNILEQFQSCEICINKTDHINVNASCTHNLCTSCKNKSDTLYPDIKGCKQCTYKEAYLKHPQCDITLCNNLSDQITGHETHTHGLCNKHTNEITKVHTLGCNICYVQENPHILDQSLLCDICKKNKIDHISINAKCEHTICTACKNESNTFHPNAEGCKTCTHIDAHLQHKQCDIDTCNNLSDHITGHKTHTHGLCDEHNLIIKKLRYHTNECKICYAQHNPALVNQQQCEAACRNNMEYINTSATCAHHLCNFHNSKTIQFKYSPIDYVKSMLQGNTCKPCFIKNNPDATSCINTTRYWGEMALLASAAGIIIYSAKKIYTWWQEKKEQKLIQEENIRPESANAQEYSA